MHKPDSGFGLNWWNALWHVARLVIWSSFLHTLHCKGYIDRGQKACSGLLLPGRFMPTCNVSALCCQSVDLYHRCTSIVQLGHRGDGWLTFFACCKAATRSAHTVQRWDDRYVSLPNLHSFKVVYRLAFNISITCRKLPTLLCFYWIKCWIKYPDRGHFMKSYFDS